MSTCHRFPAALMFTTRPTTRSPMLGMYRACSGVTERSLFVFVSVPATVDVIGGLDVEGSGVVVVP